MITGTYYFYTDRIEYINQRVHYTVIKVHIYNGCLDEAERKARTINARMGFGKMPGGMFNGKSKTYWSNYTIIHCPDNTKIQPYNAHDIFIIDLIERESNIEYTIL